MAQRRDPLEFTTIPWGQINSVEFYNAISVANAVQRAFRFIPFPSRVSLASAEYRVPIGDVNAVDLDRAVVELLKSSGFRERRNDNLVFVTAEPYCAEGDTTPDEKDLLDQGFNFYEDSVPAVPSVSIVSTYIWQQLPRRREITALKPSDRRSLEPYLLWAFGLIAINRVLDVPNHDDTRGCPFDLLFHVRDIDLFFERGRLCPLDQQFLQEAVKKSHLTRNELQSAIRLFNASASKVRSYGHDSCFISYGSPDQAFASRLYDDLKRRGIDCWRYAVDSTPGRPTQLEINEQRRLADRLLLICSTQSLGRDGVLKEIEGQLDEGPDKIIPIALDLEWRTPQFRITRGSADLKPPLVALNYADFVKEPYEHAFERLVEALKWR